MCGARSKAVRALVLAALAGAAQWAAASNVWVVELEGTIGPASADYFIRTLERAEDADADLLVLRLDTPGGLDKAMRDMVKAILASSVPVATYVAPNGSRAASAGTYLAYASHIAAMAPATNIGSSTPVNMGGGSPLPTPFAPTSDEPPPAEESPQRGERNGAPSSEDAPSAEGEPAEGESPPDDEEAAQRPPPAMDGTAMEHKVVNDAAAYIKGLAELRGRNVEWAEATVREAANLTATEALEMNVIDYIAEDLDALLAAVHGHRVSVAGADIAIDTSDPSIEFIAPDWRYELLGIITDPNVAYILLLLGIYGLIFEFQNPGIGIGAVAGGICLLLGAFALQMLPINYAGLALIFLGLGLMAAEAFSPSFGVLGIGGVVAFVIGSIILMDTDLPGYQLSTPLIMATAAITVAVVMLTVGAALRAHRMRRVSGKESMVGGRGQVVEALATEGRVLAFGEVWQARAEGGESLEKGRRVRITRMDGLCLIVEPATETEYGARPGEPDRA